MSFLTPGVERDVDSNECGGVAPITVLEGVYQIVEERVEDEHICVGEEIVIRLHGLRREVIVGRIGRVNDGAFVPFDAVSIRITRMGEVNCAHVESGDCAGHARFQEIERYIRCKLVEQDREVERVMLVFEPLTEVLVAAVYDDAGAWNEVWRKERKCADMVPVRMAHKDVDRRLLLHKTFGHHLPT